MTVVGYKFNQHLEYKHINNKYVAILLLNPGKDLRNNIFFRNLIIMTGMTGKFELNECRCSHLDCKDRWIM